MEGPSINILLELIKKFEHKKITAVKGNVTTIEIEELKGKVVKKFNSWGKHFLISFDKFYLRVHFLMFGSYNIDKPKDRPSKLSIIFNNGSLHLYTCSIQRHQGKPEDDYDWSTDLMSPKWSRTKTVNKIVKLPESEIGDILLDQNIFTGSGNIIRNETLFRVLTNPERLVKSFSRKELSQIATATKDYSYDFYRWKKEFTLKKHWLIYGKKKCKRCGGNILKKYTGETKRRSFICPACQT